MWGRGVLASLNLASLPCVTVSAAEPKFLLNAVFFANVGSLPASADTKPVTSACAWVWEIGAYRSLNVTTPLLPSTLVTASVGVVAPASRPIPLG